MLSKLTVLEPAASTLLTSLERVKSDLEIIGTADDTRITDAIGAVSDEIASFLNVRQAEDGSRTLGLETIEETFYFDGTSGFIALGRLPVVSIESVLDGETEVDAANYEFSATTGMLYRVGAGIRVPWFLPSLVGRLTVEYTAGWHLPGSTSRNLPRDIEAAAVVLVKDRTSANTGEDKIESETIFDVRSVTYATGSAGAEHESGLPRGVVNLLTRYRRLTVA